ncbi:MAG: hypothetical protein LWW85_01855 [Marinilabiliales bacterium]|nr:hypothetical protein [Marinilabiliales bacterium]
MKFVFALGIFLAMAALTFGQDNKVVKDNQLEIKKKQEQRIKILLNRDGKELKIDTSFNNLDAKVMQEKVDSMLLKLEKDGKLPGKHKFFITRSKGPGMEGFANSGEGTFTMTLDDKDTIHHKIARKVMVFSDKGDVMTIVPDGEMVPPVPPVPPIHVRGFRMGGDPFAFDPNNSDIVSYDKKDIGKGLEKIVIIRKKHDPAVTKQDIQVEYKVKDDQKK